MGTNKTTSSSIFFATLLFALLGMSCDSQKWDNTKNFYQPHGDHGDHDKSANKRTEKSLSEHQEKVDNSPSVKPNLMPKH